MSLACPRISIGMPVYNGEGYVAEAVESLLAQDCEDFELIISDNASTDRTSEICRRYSQRDSRVRYYRNPRNLGAAANFNRAFGRATAPCFMWAAHDDLHAPSCLRRCLEVLDAAGPAAVLSYPRNLIIDETGAVRGQHEDRLDIRGKSPVERLSQLLSLEMCWCHPAVGVIRTEVLRTTRLLGNYGGSDQTLLAELALRGEFHEIPERLFLRRIHSGQSPSLRSNPTPEDLAAWFDTRNRGQIALPRLRLLLEHVEAIRRAPLTRAEKWACLRLLRTCPFGAHWSRAVLTHELRRAAGKTAVKYNLAAMRRAHNHYLPHRVWALLFGIKLRRWEHIKLALAPSSGPTHAALLEFVATCLSHRTDWHSRETLQEWLSSQRDDYRLAAAVAVGKGKAPVMDRLAPRGNFQTGSNRASISHYSRP